MKRLCLTILICLLPNLSFSQSEPDILNRDTLRIDSFGYIRAGVGWRGDGGAQRCFQLPGARAKYRLGNECEIYGEAGLRFEFGPKNNGPLVSLTFRGSVVGTELNDYDTFDFFGEEAWIGISRIATDGPFDNAEFWAGHRFYKRSDVHINDFYYWDATGLGFGVTNVDFGFAAGSFAYFPDSAGNIETALDGTPYGRLDIRLEEISLPQNWTLNAGVDFRFAQDAGLANDGGGMLTLQFLRDFENAGNLELALQAGWGAGTALSFASDDSVPDHATALRGVGSYLWDASRDFSVMATAVAEVQSHSDDWYSLGIRPIWHLSGDFYVALEAGVDHVQPNGGGGARSLGKLTAALEWKPTGPDFFDRPVTRLCVTTATWDSDAEAAGIAPEFDGQSGVTFGLQVEHFW